MISAFFIERPVFAAVISILITLAGIASFIKLPVEQYPNITPPLVMVTANYMGADATTVANLVAAPIEQQVNGVENMIYMYSQNASSGTMALSVYFDIGTNPDQAQINVQNRVSLALPQLPQEVQKVGVTVQKQSPNILLIVALQSTDPRFDEIFLSNYATLNIQDELLRVNGVSEANIIGDRTYAMRLWLKPDRMAQLELTTQDLSNAIREQNAQFAVGQIGQAPTPKPVTMNFPVTTLGRLTDPSQFDEIILRANLDGSEVLMQDVARAELGAQDYSVVGTLDGKTATLVAVYLQYGANALEVAEAVKKSMEKMAENFPAGIEYSIPYDTTKFIKISIAEVERTILEAAVLVVIVVLVFLQNLRATIVPVVAMTVSIIGTFAGMYMLDFSLNMLTLFGLVLAIGTVVDDAIVVVENIERNMREHALPPIEAAKLAMEEVTGPVIAIVFVLCAVFIPVAFLGGIAGQLYQQFAITIAISVMISGIVAITFSPALSALLLKLRDRPSRFTLMFNSVFDVITNHYIRYARWLIHHPKLGMLSFAGVLAAIYALFQVVPGSFVPDEDQGYIIAMSIMPDASSVDRTYQVDQEILRIANEDPSIDHLVSFSGFSFIDGVNRSTYGSDFIVLKDWAKREKPSEFADAIRQRLTKQFSAIPQGVVVGFNPPAIQGLGTVGGFEFWIQNRSERTVAEMEAIVQDFIAKASKRPELAGLTTSFQANNMQLYIDLDRNKARSLGLNISDVYETLQVQLGALYVNDFNKFGRVYQVIMQAEPSYRSSLQGIGEMYVKGKEGNMIPLTSVVSTKFITGPTLLSRFNGFIAAKINGNSGAGYSSGEAMNALEHVAREVLPDDMTFAWSGQSYQERASSGAATIILLAGLVVVFLILAALYERWSLPVAILLAVPFGILGALLATWFRGLANDIYFQVGLVTLIGLSAKNAILIVEFALIKEQEGLSSIDAALEAARLRFRAILMTSLTFIFGVIPLVISTGAGAASRHAVGTGVLGGMIGATALAIFFVPLFYVLIQGWTQRKQS
ncbi:MAG: multidrug efflux RND transporter permease subunit [Chlamydiales bacterium]|nr:multidrug efflux RND transporter permease subunit [Chlamydiales bacterium]